MLSSVKKNVETKLASHGVPDHQQYILEIFGKQDGTVYEKRLLDATRESSSMHYWLLFRSPEPEERSLHPTRVHLVFIYGCSNDDMMKSVRTGAGLGIPP